MSEEHDGTINPEDFEVYEFEALATCVIETRFMVVGRTEEEARARWQSGHHENYFLPLGVEEWTHINYGQGSPFPASDEETMETIGFMDFDEVLESIADLEEEA
jgi:hypothetical protein